MKRQILALLCMGCIASVASAQYSSDFESLNASGAGVVLTGQDGYYIPAGTNSVDYSVYTYAGNALMFPDNPTGGSQFIAGTGPAGTPDLFFARAQRDVSYAASDLWTISFDICVTFIGALPTAQNIGSVSSQPVDASASVIVLATWSDINTAENWNADMVWYDDFGKQLTEQIPDPAFQNLETNHWYRQTCTFDLLTNQVLEVSLTDLMSNETFTYSPPDRYLNGGAAGGLPLPTAFRFFAGGGVDGNTLGFDNISIAVPGDDCLLGDVNLDGAVTLLDVDPFVIVLTSGKYQCEADINEDGAVTLLDVNPFVDLLSGG